MLPYVIGLVLVVLAAIVVFLLALPWWIAAVIALIVGGVLLARFVYRLVLAKRSAAGLEKALMAQSNALGAQVRPDQQGEIAALQREFQGAIESLKGSRLSRKGASALYALPWYAIIGPPGAGKSTALRASGLTFPQMAGGKKSAIRGIGGTRNCDWWLTNEAVLLDTAGRYTTEDDDREEWFAFLDLLKKHRARKPINGIMVAVSVTDIALATDEQLSALAEQIRERLDEVIGKLGVVVPVYLVFTKCDLISGFIETFEELSREQRSQVLGFTMPVARTGVDPDEVTACFDRLSDTVRDAAFHRMGAERRIAARERVFVFAQEFEGLRENVIDFISRVFVENIYHDTPVFRGAYFTSGTQEGRPIERVLSKMTGALGGAALPAALPSNVEARSYFLGELFTRIMFPDAELTRHHPLLGLSRRRARGHRLRGAHGELVRAQPRPAAQRPQRGGADDRRE
jgi:type VI secretion system protein ImpL